VEYSKLLNSLQEDLAKIRSSGQSTVDIEALQKYIETGLSPDQPDRALEHTKLEQQQFLAHLDVRTRHEIELFKSVIEAGREALNALILINGGAVVALLGFLGATISKGLPAELGLHLTPSILSFGAGVLAGSLSLAVRYVTQFCYGHGRIKIGNALNLASISLAGSGYILFAYGIYTAYEAFVTQFSPL